MISLLRPALLIFLLTGLVARAERTTWQMSGTNFTVEPNWSYGALITVPREFPTAPHPLRGILLWGNGAGSDERARAYDLELVELAEQLDFALMATARWGNLSDPVQVDTLEDVFSYLGDASDQPWLTHAPILPLGMSNGGQMSYGINALWPERTLAFAANKGGFYNNPLPSAAALATPGLLITGGADEAYRRDAILELFNQNRPRGARWAWAEEEGAGHALVDSLELILPFAAEMAGLRYPLGTPLTATTPAALTPVALESGWLVARDEHLTGLATLALYADYAGDPALASWLPSRRLAYIYRAFASHDKASPTAVLTPDWPTVERGVTLTYTIAPTDPTWTRIDYFEGDTLLRSVTPADTDPFHVDLTPQDPGFVVLHALVTLADGRQRTTMPRRKLIARGHRDDNPPSHNLLGERHLDTGSTLDLYGQMVGLNTQPPPTEITWLRNGQVLPGQNTARLTLTDVGPADAGIYELHTRTFDFRSFSDPLHVYVSDPEVPSLGALSGPATVPLGGHATFRVAEPTERTDLSYEWSLNGRVLPNETGPTLDIPLVQSRHAGTYTVRARIRQTTSPAATATLAVEAPPISGGRLLNLSVRGLHRGGNEAMIVGFVTTGGDKTLLARAVGPALFRLDFPGTLTDPALLLQRPQTPPTPPLTLAENDNWGDAPDPAAIANAAARVGAFALDPADADASLLRTLPPGRYSAATSGAHDGTGVVLLELYDADETPGAGQLVNLSNRGYVAGESNVLVAGFVVGDEGPVDLLIRAVGPGLAPHGVTDFLPSPRFTLHHHVPVATGPAPILLDALGWTGGSDADDIRAAAAAVGAFPLPDQGFDTATLVRLQPGVYSVVVRGLPWDQGITLLELYQLP